MLIKPTFNAAAHTVLVVEAAAMREHASTDASVDLCDLRELRKLDDTAVGCMDACSVPVETRAKKGCGPACKWQGIGSG